MSSASQPESQVRFFDHIYRPRAKKLQLPYDSLDHGTRVPIDEAECERYIGLYGGHHFHKLYKAFASTNFQNTEGMSVEIIDWGCGQALATCVLIDYLIEKQICPDIVAITLMEPSLIALCRGYSFVREMLKPTLWSNCEIRPINKYMDSLYCSDFNSDPNAIKVHLFSNIIDVENFDLEKLYKLIINCFQGVNRIICTSPYLLLRNSRLDTFYNFFCEYHQVKNSYHFDEAIRGEIFNVRTGRFEPWRIERYERQFRVNLR